MIRKLSALFAVSALLLAACTPPALTAHGFSPAGAATDVPVDTTVSATLNIAPLAASVVNALTLTSGEEATPVAGSVAYNSSTRTITFTPAAPLEYATTYTASLSANIRTSDGTRISGSRTWSFTTEDAPATGVVSVTIDQGDISLLTGETATLTTTVEVDGEVPETVTWSSDDETVASVSNDGVVTAVASGTATVTATSTADTSVSDSVIVTVADEPAVISVAIVEGDQELYLGADLQLSADVQAVGGADASVTWESDDETVATVSDTGLVSSVGLGTAVITATSVADPALADSVTVTVVVAPAVTDLSIDGTDRVVTLSDDVAFTATVTVEGSATDAVTWTSSDETVATIDPDTGEATLVGAGDTIIAATSVFDDTFSDSVTLTVAAPLAFAGDYATSNGTANVQTAIDLEVPATIGGYGTVTYALVAGSTLPADFIVDDGVSPVTYSVTLDATTGAISGATGYPGTYTGFVEATDELGQTTTAAYSITLLLDFTYVAADLVTPTTEFVYNPSAATPEYVVPGIQVRISGVENTDWLPADLSDDLQFSFAVVGATDILGDPIAAPDSSGVTINTVEGTFYRAGPITDADWAFDVTLTNLATSETVTLPVTWLNADWIAIP